MSIRKISKLFFVAFLSLSSVYATNVVIPEGQEPSLGNLNMEFCNEGFEDKNILTLSLEEEVAQEICIEISNSSRYPATVNIEFVDGSVTNDENQKPSCKTGGIKAKFGQYVTGFEDFEIFQLSGNSTTKATGMIKFPSGYAGKAPGCVTYRVLNAESGDGAALLNVITRKAKIIDAVVDGTPISDFSLGLIDESYDANYGENVSSNDFVGVYRTANGFSPIYSFENKGNIPQEVSYLLTFNGSFGFSFQQSGTRLVLPGENVSQNNLFENIPWYVFKSKVTLEGESLAKIPDGMSVGTGFNPQPYVFVESTNITMITLTHLGIILVALIILLMLIIFLKKKNKKKNQESNENKEE